MVIVRQYFTRDRPQLPDAAVSRTIAVSVNYGKTVFVTAREKEILYGSYIALGVAVTVTLILYCLAQSRRNNSGK
jgi:hypothetical protein